MKKFAEKDFVYDDNNPVVQKVEQREATPKMVAFACLIADILDYPYPDFYSFSKTHAFIRDTIDEYNEVMDDIRDTLSLDIELDEDGEWTGGRFYFSD